MNYNIRYGVCCPKGNTVNNPVQGRAAAAARGLGKTAYCHCKLLLLLAAAAVAWQGCELESVKYDAINTTMFPKTATDAEALVTGSCYYNFQAGWEYLFGNHLMFNEWSSDIGETDGWRWMDIFVYGRWTASVTQGGLTGYWEGVKRISGMTLTIDRIGGIDMDETHKNRLIAEVRVGRAYLAHLLYDIFGPVPIADLETLKNPLEEKVLPRATEEEMQQFIEDDLLAAINATELPDVYKKGDAEYGRFSRGIAYMVLLKFYMQTRQWEKAIGAGRELLKKDVYGYDLVPKYKDIFTLANEKNEETIYSYNAKTMNRGHAFQAICAPADLIVNSSGIVLDGQNAYKLAWWFIDTFDPDDERLKDGIVTEYTGSTGIAHSREKDAANGLLKYGAVPFKYEVESTMLPNGWWSEIDKIHLRYADALTLLAEAIVRNGNTVTDEAITLLNRVRLRAFANNQQKAYTSASFASPRAFLDSLLMERAHELFWENCRRQDLVRDGSYVEAMKKKCQIAGEGTLVQAGYERFPIPQSVINEGKGIILQNDPY